MTYLLQVLENSLSPNISLMLFPGDVSGPSTSTSSVSTSSDVSGPSTSTRSVSTSSDGVKNIIDRGFLARIEMLEAENVRLKTACQAKYCMPFSIKYIEGDDVMINPPHGAVTNATTLQHF